MERDSFAQFFEKITGFPPYAWQTCVAEQGFCDVLNVPTGLGKTEGAVLAWAWRRLKLGGEPRHLVYCLPVRSLVRQTVERLRGYFQRLGNAVAVYELMGGSFDEEWMEQPEKLWVLVGTQDQLLSRALNRGFAMSRFEWPVAFGLLNNDCRWIVDEVQLMGPGLWTTAQLDWMRKKRFGTVFDCPTTWMSATLGVGFLDTEDRKTDNLNKPRCLPVDIIEQDSTPEIVRRRQARKQLSIWEPPKTRGKKVAEIDKDVFFPRLAQAVTEKHCAGTLTLVVCNTVETAQRLFQCLSNDIPKVLLTSRFRTLDRRSHEQSLLEFEACRKAIELERERAGRNDQLGQPLPDCPGLICVSTQVVEAGLDISARHLWTEMAPWPSLVQRLGRVNRDGRDPQAGVWFWQAPPPRSVRKENKGEPERIGPYEAEDVELAHGLVAELVKRAQGEPEQPFGQLLRGVTEKLRDKITKALEPKPSPLPRALDLHSLFSTERDVHGGFTDISPFVRSSDPDADLTVVWRDWQGPRRKFLAGEDLSGPPVNPGTEGCPVAAYRLREVLQGRGSMAWLWNDEAERWEVVRLEDLRPGMVVLLHREAGGYSKELGWTGDPAHRLDQVPRVGPGRGLLDDRRTEIGFWVPLHVHLRDAQAEAERLCAQLQLSPELSGAVVQAAAHHDLGKAHAQWQSMLPSPPESIGSGPWAKCPSVLAVVVTEEAREKEFHEQLRRLRPAALRIPTRTARDDEESGVRLWWAIDRPLTSQELSQLRDIAWVVRVAHKSFRPGLRHEAASALAMWYRYRHATTDYPALAVYLVAAHHGKVRTVFRSLTDSGDDAFGVPRDGSAIVFSGKSWSLDFSVVKDGAEGTWTQSGFELQGVGWTALVADLLGPWHPMEPPSTGAVPKEEPRALGPFKLAYLEALVRIADWRASRNPSQRILPSAVEGR